MPNNFRKGDTVHFGYRREVSRTDGPFVYFTNGGCVHYEDVTLVATGDSGQTLGNNHKIQTEIAAGRMIEAIKLYRSEYGVGLREAKDAVEAMRDSKFKVGDRVKCHLDNDTGTVAAINARGEYRVDWDKSPTNYYFCGDNLTLIASNTIGPAIVARKNGSLYQPSPCPVVHATTDDAVKEAERLARANPGVEFGTFVLAHKSTATVPTVSTVAA